MAVKPVIYGPSDRPPRGDYSRAGADYTCQQHYAAYTRGTTTPTGDCTQRQSALLPG